MWLLNTTTLSLTDIPVPIPPYAILSHTWSISEVLFLDMQTHPLPPSTTRKPGFAKVSRFCALAKSYGFEYGWVDSCCIDKRSSAELSEAINSMYMWYRDAGLCVVYLDDVPGLELAKGIGFEIDTWTKRFKTSRWFTRGWTLQELIGSKQRVFFAHDWSEISSTRLSTDFNIDLIDLIATITLIPPKVLHDASTMPRYCIASRMSWASSRQTTRPEDGAYSLLGLFNIAIPILYGEGLSKAFARLQEEIMKSTFDQTLFAWRGPYQSSGLLAHYPSDFANTPQLEVWRPDMLVPHYMTNTGLYLRPCILKSKPIMKGPLADTLLAVLQCDVKTDKGWSIVMVRLKAVEEATCWVNGEKCKAYRRVDCGKLEVRPPGIYESPDLLVLEDRHFDLVQTAMRLHDRRWAEGSNYRLRLS